MAAKAGTVQLENYPRLNPLLPALLGNLMGFANSFSDSGGVPWYAWIIMAIIIVWMMRYTISLYWRLETPPNIRCALNVFLDKFNKYGDGRSQRQGLRAYISQLQAAGLPDSNLAMTNFYVCSSNSPAIFTPLRDGIASPDALRLTFAAGARYLDFNIWSDDKKNNYRPMLKGMDVGSQWRRITMTEMTFQSAMDNVAKYGMAGPYADSDTNSAPYRDDPLFIMLRFKGKLRNSTYTQVANILRKTIEQNRLDFTYNKGRGMENLFKVPVTEFFNKVIIMCNVYPPDGNLLLDYINIGPRGAYQSDISSKEIKSIPDTERPSYVKKIVQHFTVSRSEMEEPDSDKNKNDWTVAHSSGVHFAAMNFWSEDDLLKSYLAQDNFGRCSFKIKPEPLRYVITYIKPPLLPNPELNARDGKPIAPPGIMLPN